MKIDNLRTVYRKVFDRREEISNIILQACEGDKEIERRGRIKTGCGGFGLLFAKQRKANSHNYERR